MRLQAISQFVISSGILLATLSGGLASAQSDRTIDKYLSDGVLRLPAGTMKISETIEIALSESGHLRIESEGRTRLVMEGKGPAIRLVGTHGGTADPKTVKPKVWDRQNAPIITGLEIVGAHPEADGIELKGTMQPTLRDLTIRKTRHAIHLVERNRNVLISDCHLYENSGAGVYYDHVNLHQSNITGCHISYNHAGGVVIRGGDVRNVHITGCDIEGNMGEAEDPATANVLLEADDGSIGEVAITGCTIQHSHDALNSANIRIDFLSPKRPFTEELRHGNVTITGNVLSDVQVNVDIKNARGVAVTGNTIWKGYDRNIRVDNSSAVVISGNTFDRNPRYHYGDGPDAKLGLELKSCQRCVVASNAIHGVGEIDAAIDVSDSTQIQISGNTIAEAPDAAIRLENVSQSRITDCIIDVPPGGKGIVELNSMGNSITDNTLIDAD